MTALQPNEYPEVIIFTSSTSHMLASLLDPSIDSPLAAQLLSVKQSQVSASIGVIIKTRHSDGLGGCDIRPNFAL